MYVIVALNSCLVLTSRKLPRFFLSYMLFNFCHFIFVLLSICYRPLDLCDANLSLDAVTPGSGNQICHANGMTPNQHGSAGPTTTPPTPNPNSRVPGSPGMVLGGNFSPPSALSAPSR